MPTNEFDQPIGPPLDGWHPPSWPEAAPLIGQYVSLQPLDLDRHAEALFARFALEESSLWTYLPWGPFDRATDLRSMLAGLLEADWVVYAIERDTGADAPEIVGVFSYLRINPSAGSIEIGGIIFSSALQKTTAATEALYLLMANSFASGFRRLEWKCDDLNAPSRRAALRLGFTYEGTFRKATHYDGRSRDTAWFSITDDEWPALDAGFGSWLASNNFDPDGTQQRSLHR